MKSRRSIAVIVWGVVSTRPRRPLPKQELEVLVREVRPDCATVLTVSAESFASASVRRPPGKRDFTNGFWLVRISATLKPPAAARWELMKITVPSSNH